MDALHYYTKLLDDLIDRNDFYKLFFQHPSCLECDREEFEFGLYFGATRCGLVPTNDECGWILKFDTDYDGRNTSLCETEIELYEKAVQYGVQNCFCEAKFLGWYEKDILFYEWNEIEDLVWCADEEEFQNRLSDIAATTALRPIHITLPLYAYRYAKDISLWGLSSTEEERRFVRSHRSPLTQRNENVGLRLLQDWGEEAYKELEKFVEKFRINDLHGGNIGEIDGKIVLTDYAGYHDEEYEEYENESRNSD